MSSQTKEQIAARKDAIENEMNALRDEAVEIFLTKVWDATKGSNWKSYQAAGFTPVFEKKRELEKELEELNPATKLDKEEAKLQAKLEALRKQKAEFAE